MKKKYLFVTICSLLLLILCSCDARESGSLKSLTRPYIAHYECTQAVLGDENLLDKFDYIELVLLNKEKMQLIYKPKSGVRHIEECKYSFNTESRELTAEIGILGYKFRESTIIEHGKFTISKTIGKKQLIMKFETK